VSKDTSLSPPPTSQRILPLERKVHPEIATLLQIAKNVLRRTEKAGTDAHELRPFPPGWCSSSRCADRDHGTHRALNEVEAHDGVA
jgi:hypothetical protein